MNDSQRRDEIRGIHRKHRLFYEVLGGGAILVVGILIGAAFFGGGNQDYHMNLVTEGMGIVATVFIINRWYAHRDRQLAEEERLRNENRLKGRLLRDAKGPSHDNAVSAIAQMVEEGWLTGDDSLLKDQDLSFAKLQNVDLRGANLEGADLGDADLSSAKLAGANLRNADLSGADLCYAIMENAMLEYANLRHAKMQRTDLSNANLTDACLIDANLHIAILFKTVLVRAKLTNANTEGVYVRNANFDGAELIGANLRDCDLNHSNLRDAVLFAADLQNASLIGTDLEGADLRGAYMEGARVVPKKIVTPIVEDNKLRAWSTKGATRLDGALLPDGSRFDTDDSADQLERFTDPNHPQFDETLARIEDIRNAPGNSDWHFRQRQIR